MPKCYLLSMSACILITLPAQAMISNSSLPTCPTNYGIALNSICMDKKIYNPDMRWSVNNNIKTSFTQQEATQLFKVNYKSSKQHHSQRKTSVLRPDQLLAKLIIPENPSLSDYQAIAQKLVDKSYEYMQKNPTSNLALWLNGKLDISEGYEVTLQRFMEAYEANKRCHTNKHIEQGMTHVIHSVVYCLQNQISSRSQREERGVPHYHNAPTISLEIYKKIEDQEFHPFSLSCNEPDTLKEGCYRKGQTTPEPIECNQRTWWGRLFIGAVIGGSTIGLIHDIYHFCKQTPIKKRENQINLNETVNQEAQNLQQETIPETH